MNLNDQLRADRRHALNPWLAGVVGERWPGDDGRVLDLAEFAFWSPEAQAAEKAEFARLDDIYEKAKAEAPPKIAAFIALADKALEAFKVGWFEGGEAALTAADDGSQGMESYPGAKEKYREMGAAGTKCQIEAYTAILAEAVEGRLAEIAAGQEPDLVYLMAVADNTYWRLGMAGDPGPQLKRVADAINAKGETPNA